MTKTKETDPEPGSRGTDEEVCSRQGRRVNGLGHIGQQASGEGGTPIELFIAGVRGWEADVRRQVEGD